MNVTVIHLCDLVDIKGDAKLMLDHALSLGVEFVKFDSNYHIPNHTDVVIDALLGTGLNKAVSGQYLEAIKIINKANVYTISADIPSGVCANTGSVLGDAVKANKTCTFIGYKKGLFTSDAPDCVGELILNTLKIPDEIYSRVQPDAEKLFIEEINTITCKRKQNTNKGSFGNLVVIAGDKGMPGAALMNSISALRVGAGKVNLITHPEHSNIICANAPEIMSHGLTDESDIISFCEKASAILIGSGTSLGNKWSEKMFAIIRNINKPIIADAGILDFIKNHKMKSNDLIITPHPGEAARMLNISTNEINQDRFRAVDELAQKLHCTAILKGKGTLIKSIVNPQTYLCPYGNSAMATAGMGDVLAGMIAGLRAQGYSALDASKIGVTRHSYIADQLVLKEGKKQLIASDIYLHL
jgi:NAD(P)H-hydrate epimerase